MTTITPDSLAWHHAGLDAFAIIDHYTIRDAILSNPYAPFRYAIYEQIDGDEVHRDSFRTIDEVVAYLNDAQ